MEINDIQDWIIRDFIPLEGWFDRYQYLIKKGSELPAMDQRYKITDNSLIGCQSRVWIAAELVDGKIIFYADSDAKITRGIIAVLLNVVNGHTPKEIYNAEFYFLERIGFKSNLSPARVNGLNAIVKRIYELSKMYM